MGADRVVSTFPYPQLVKCGIIHFNMFHVYFGNCSSSSKLSRSTESYVPSMLVRTLTSSGLSVEEAEELSELCWKRLWWYILPTLSKCASLSLSINQLCMFWSFVLTFDVTTSATINWPIDRENVKAMLPMVLDNVTNLLSQGWAGYFTVCQNFKTFISASSCLDG